MSDTIDEVDPGTLRVPNSTGDNTTETYGVWYPYDGKFVDSGTLGKGGALDDLDWARTENAPETRGAMAVKITIERIDV